MSFLSYYLLISLLLFQPTPMEENLFEREFYQINFILSYNNNIVVVDVIESAIYLFDAEGNYITKTGRRGQGPGEFRVQPIWVVTGDNCLYAGDIGFVHQFDTELNYLKSIPNYDEGTFIQGYNGENNTFYFISGLFEVSNFKRYSEALEVLNYINVESLNRQVMRNWFELATTDNNLFMLWKYLNRIEIRDHSGDILKTCEADKFPNKVEFTTIDINIPDNLDARVAEVLELGSNVPKTSMVVNVVSVDDVVLVQYGRTFTDELATIDENCTITYDVGIKIPGVLRAHHNGRLIYTYDQSTRVGFYPLE